MEESQGIDINEVALDNIVPMDAPSNPAPEPAITPEPLPTNDTTEPAEPQTPAETAPAQSQDPEPEPEAPQEPQGTGSLDDPIKIQTEGETETPEEPAPAGPDSEWNEEEQGEIFNENLSYYTEGKIQSIEDINKMAKELETLKGQPQQPEFTSESAKKLFEFAQNSENPLAMGKNYLHAVSLDLETLSDKQKMFEAYVLDEQNSDLTREQALEIFNEDYEESYADAEDSVTGKRKVTLAVRTAEEKIKSMQGEAMDAKSKDASSAPVSPEYLEEINGNITASLDDLDSISIHASENNQFNFEVGQQDMDRYSTAAKDPVQWLQNEIASFQNETTGKFDYDGYSAFIGSLLFSGQIAEGMFKHGQNNGKTAMVNSLQNPSKPGSTQPTAPTADNRKTEEKIWDKLEEKMGSF